MNSFNALQLKSVSFFSFFRWQKAKGVERRGKKKEKKEKRISAVYVLMKAKVFHTQTQEIIKKRGNCQKIWFMFDFFLLLLLSFSLFLSFFSSSRLACDFFLSFFHSRKMRRMIICMRKKSSSFIKISFFFHRNGCEEEERSWDLLEDFDEIYMCMIFFFLSFPSFWDENILFLLERIFGKYLQNIIHCVLSIIGDEISMRVAMKEWMNVR